MSLTKCNDAIGFQNQENEGFVCAAAFAYLMYRDLLLICNCNCVISIHILKSTLKPNVFSCKLYCHERIIHQIQMAKTTELTNVIIKDSTILLSNTAS